MHWSNHNGVSFVGIMTNSAGMAVRPKEMWKERDGTYSKERFLNLHQIASDLFKIWQNMGLTFPPYVPIQKQKWNPYWPFTDHQNHQVFFWSTFQGTVAIEALQNHLRPLPRFQEVFLKGLSRSRRLELVGRCFLGLVVGEMPS